MLNPEAQVKLSLEIFTNPHRLQIRVVHTGKLRARRSYGFCIKVGEGKQICSGFFGSSKKEVVRVISTNLSNILNNGRDLLQTQKETYPQFFDDHGRPTGPFLEQGVIDWIIETLDRNFSSIADTSKMLTKVWKIEAPARKRARAFLI